MSFKTFEQYVESNEHEKRVWFWPCKWFVYPYALTSVDWIKFDSFIKNKYPVQYFLREKIDMWFYHYIAFPFKRTKTTIKYSIRNPRKEMRSKVFPRYWSDLSETIVIFHLEAIIEFVDREEGLTIIDYSSSKEQAQFQKELKECYEYAKTGRNAMHKKLNEAYSRVPDTGSYSEVYKEVNDIEKEIHEYDTKVCEWVINNRMYFWV